MAISKEFKELARHAARRTAPTNYEVADIDQAFAKELANYCGSISQFMKNRYDLYEIIAENVDEIVPGKTIQALGTFAEVVQLKQNEKRIFRTSTLNSKLRAKKFLTQVGLSGVYETFRLDRDTYEVNVKAIGGAVTIDFERMLDNAESLADVMEVITEGLIDSVFLEVGKALESIISSTKLPEKNKVSKNTFDSADMFALTTIAKSYGNGSATIFATPEFIGAMGPDAIVPLSTVGIYHGDDIDAIHKTGYINLFRGTPVVPIPQSFTDTTHEKTWINPQYAYVLPAGREKIVKVVLEGDTQMHDFTNRDNSMEIHVYKKMGTAIESYNAVCVYQNTSL